MTEDFFESTEPESQKLLSQFFQGLEQSHLPLAKEQITDFSFSTRHKSPRQIINAGIIFKALK
jgi:hypothetical protein